MPKTKKSKKISKPNAAAEVTVTQPADTEEIQVPVLSTQAPAESTPKKSKAGAAKAQPEKKVAVAEESRPTFLEHLKQDRKLQMMLLVGSGLLLMAAGIGMAVILQPRTNNGHVVIKVDNTNNALPTNNLEPAKPTVLPRHLDGLMVAAAAANNVPACVMIENAAFQGVRPQSGISAAQVVYEIIVEGGITRWMAVFAGEKADVVGPVRSARDTYLEFASELNCAYFHAGGSYTAMRAIENFKLRNIDSLREYKWFWRDSSKYSPHNLFTKTDNLYDAINNGHNWKDAPTYTPWHFVDDEDIAGGEAATEVNIHFGGAYDVHYVYNTDSKDYERSNGGVPQTDANTDKVLTARNIIIEKVPPGEVIEGKGRINFSVTGEGETYIFRLGQLTKGTWKKADRLSRTQFFTDDGKEIPLARGTSWVEIVPEDHPFDWK